MTIRTAFHPAQPSVRDATALVHEACLQNNMLEVVLEEARRAEGQIALFLPGPSEVSLDGQVLSKKAVGYQTYTHGKGKHAFQVRQRT